VLVYRALAEHIFGLAIDVHRNIGPGLLESVYLECLGRELKEAGIPFQRQVMMPVPNTYWLINEFRRTRLKDGLRRFIV
jgi:GxxExxY protein